MWSSRRGALILACGALAGACGFAPVYGPGGHGAALRGAVRVADPEDAFGFAFVRSFEARLGMPEMPRYDLRYTKVLGEEELGIDGSANITRYNVIGRLHWTLSPRGGEEVLRSGQEKAFTSYAATGSTISTLESRDDAYRRLAVILADAVVAALMGGAEGL